MHRAMTGFRRDDDGAWVAELSCLHSQHIRHEPPFSGGRLDRGRRGSAPRASASRSTARSVTAPSCPEGLEPTRTTATWDATTVPAALRRAHRVAARTWGLLEVEAGEVRFQADTDPPLDVVVTPDRPQPIPPELDHHIEPSEDARFHVDLPRPGLRALGRGWRAGVRRPPPRGGRALLTKLASRSQRRCTTSPTANARRSPSSVSTTRWPSR